MRKPAGAAESPANNSKYFVIIIALLSVYLFWGGTYVGIKVAVETMPPFLMAGVRFFTAGCVLYAVARLQGHGRPRLAEWRGAGIVGALLLLGGNGAVAWAEQSVPSSIASLLVATVPLWMLLFQSFGKHRKTPTLGVVIGMVLGFLGIAVLTLPGGDATLTVHSFGIVILLIASISWSFGSLYARRATLPASPLLSTALQMIVGGSLLIIASLFLDDLTHFDVTAISLRSLLAFAYLIVGGSIVGYTAYVWLLQHADPSWVSTYAFVNPIIAVFLGWFLVNEQLSPRAWLSAAIIVAAVVLITVFRNRPLAQASKAREKGAAVHSLSDGEQS